MLDTKMLDTQEVVLNNHLDAVDSQTNFLKSANFTYILTAVLTIAVCLQIMLLVQGPIPLLIIGAIGIIAISYFYSLRLSMILLLLCCVGYILASNIASISVNRPLLQEMSDSFVGTQVFFTLVSISLASYTRILKTGLRWQEQLKHFANTHDDLTLLLNKESFIEKLDDIIATSPNHQERFALVLIDINGLEKINLKHGYNAGNTALNIISDRLRQAAQRDDLVARIDEDCFALVVRKMAHKAQLKGYVKRVKAMLNLPFDYGWKAINLKTKMVSSFYPVEGKTASELLVLTESKLKKNRI